MTHVLPPRARVVSIVVDCLGMTGSDVGGGAGLLSARRVFPGLARNKLEGFTEEDPQLVG